jgi:hypothetical protein
MKVLRLTEYRADGNFYPLVVVVVSNFAAFEAELAPTGPHIIGQTKTLGKGAFLVGAVPGKNLAVRETVEEIVELLKDKTPFAK